ncbi:Sec-independent protein translocase protein TatB [Acinetobacter larvae]|uniref:Twin arginine-targeting protein translocase TatB n=1 Tax=Acinetobacter larvae TaxID=1789224 RepID=A0A1B2M0Y7_9GAMM|nr:Sec-independent protein translocase protein TatB [Acinetobacter larvae]AOA58821.1 twin arginine-targeting protein translocase TatB [Acinetobacter larvae]
MFDVGFGEIFFLGIIAIIVLGPEKLPEVLRYIAKLKRKFDILKNDLNNSLQKELELNQLKHEVNAEMSNLRILEKKLDLYLKNITAEEIPEQKYYPVEHFVTPIPFNAKFILDHLMSWPCFEVQSSTSSKHRSKHRSDNNRE